VPGLIFFTAEHLRIRDEGGVTTRCPAAEYSKKGVSIKEGEMLPEACLCASDAGWGADTLLMCVCEGKMTARTKGVEEWLETTQQFILGVEGVRRGQKSGNARIRDCPVPSLCFCFYRP